MKVELVTYTPNIENVPMESSEHATFTFAIEGVSRALTHQLVRYGITLYGQESQRYVKTDGFDYVIPESIKNHEKTWDEDGKTDVEKWYRNAMDGLSEFYTELIEAGIPEEDASYILPNATCTNIVFTMNVRALRHLFCLKVYSRVRWEIREMANLMLEKVREVAPMLFEEISVRDNE